MAPTRNFRPAILLMAGIACLAASGAQAVAFTTPFSFSQNFNSLPITSVMGNWVNDSTLPGWSAFFADGSAQNVYLSGTGSVTTGHLWNLASTTTATDRAFGSRTTSAAQTAIIAVAMPNNSGEVVNSIALSFDGEQYRYTSRNVAQTVVLSYGIGATYASVSDWTAPGGSFNFSSPVIGTTATRIDGNTTGLVAGLGGILSTTVNPGDTLWVRWTFPSSSAVDSLGSDTLAIDNFSAMAVPEPTTYALMLGGLVGVVALTRRRKT